jgi:MFS family permease
MADSAISAPPATHSSSTAATAVFDSLRMPVYRTVWIGTILAFLAYNAWSPALGVVAYDLTGNNGTVGLVIFGQGIAMFLLNPFSGAIADRVSKKLLITGCQAVAFVTMLSVGVLVALDLISVPLLVLAAFSVGVMYSFNGPARNALLGDLIPEDRLGNAIALMQVGANFARTAAPFIAGALLSWEAIGPSGTFFFMACIMAAVILTYLQIPRTPVRSDRNQTSLLQDVRRGLSHVRQSPQLLQSIMSFQAVAILGFSYIVLIPGFSKDVMDAGNAGVGILLGAAAAGGVVTSLIAAGAADSRYARTLLHGSTLLLGLALVGFGLSPSFPVAVVMMALVGGGSSAFRTLNNVTALRHAHRDYYGRVMGFMFIAWGLTNLAGLPVGALADAVGERSVLVGLGGLLCLATAGFVLWARAVPEEPRPAPHVIVVE